MKKAINASSQVRKKSGFRFFDPRAVVREDIGTLLGPSSIERPDIPPRSKLVAVLRLGTSEVALDVTDPDTYYAFFMNMYLPAQSRPMSLRPSFRLFVMKEDALRSYEHRIKVEIFE